MIWVIVAICVLFLVGSIFFFGYDEDSGIFLIGVSVCCLVASIIVGIVLGAKMTDKYGIDEQIAIYEEENAKLEEEVDAIVKSYMRFEQETYEQFKNESSTVLIQLFPELKSNEVIQRQLSILEENKNQIVALKIKRTKLMRIHWWLTFKYE